MNCQQERELFTHGICQRCNMAMRRENQRHGQPTVSPDRSQARQRAALSRMRDKFSGVLTALFSQPLSEMVASAARAATDHHHAHPVDRPDKRDHLPGRAGGDNG
jgi:hypothetical protein